MKKVSPLLLIIILIMALSLVACGGGEEAAPDPTEAPAAAVETEVEPEAETESAEEPAVEEEAAEEAPTEEPAAAEEEAAAEEAPAEEEAAETTPADPLDSMEHNPDPNLVDVVWQWVGRDPNGNETEAISIPNPENYTLQFSEDGTFAAKLDCNNGAGEYKTPSPGNIFMQLGPMTMVACEESSYAPQMGQMFGPVQSYSFEEDGAVLVMPWVAGGPVDYFRDAAAEDPGDEEVEGIPEDSIQIDLNGLAESFTWEVIPQSPIPPGPGGQGFPAHIFLTFDGATAEQVLPYNGPWMYIYPKDAYVGMYNMAGNPVVANQVALLQELIVSADARAGAAPEGAMPLLPPPSSLMERWVQFADLDFGVGTGVRYISDAPNRQQIGPWTNETTSYFYQGETSDGTFYVSLHWPESTESLPNTAADVPEDVMNAASNPDTAANYQSEIKGALNALGAADWTPTLTQLDALANSITFPLPGEEADGELTGTSWQWLGTTTPVEEITVANPANYTILFNEDGSANIKADCNNVGATYTADDSSINIALGPSTRAACPEGSQDQVFLNGLSNAAIYFFQDGDLYIDMFADGGTMHFQVGEEVDLPEPEDGEATATVTAPDGIYVRTGPGTQYPEVGAVPFGETGTIVGVSEDGQWWVVEMPVSDKTPDGIGWISAQFVEATNADNVPVVETPPLEPPLTGINWAWHSTTTPVGVTAVNEPNRYTILFNTDGSANIKADCNNVGATYTADGSNISITPGASTLAACPSDTQDQIFLSQLTAAAIYFFEGSDLMIDMAADAGTMRLIPAPQVDPVPPTAEPPTSGATGTNFQLVSFGPVGAQQPPLPGTFITALFEDAQVSGNAGCNDYSAALTPLNDFFTVGPVATTQKICNEPAGIMEQEAAYLAALQGTAGYQWAEDASSGNLVTGGQIFYILQDGTNGIINYITQ